MDWLGLAMGGVESSDASVTRSQQGFYRTGGGCEIKKGVREHTHDVGLKLSGHEQEEFDASVRPPYESVRQAVRHMGLEFAGDVGARNRH